MVNLAYRNGYGVMPCSSRGEGSAIALSAKPKPAPCEPRQDLAGEEVSTEAGTVLVCTKRYPESYHHGLFSAADFLRTGPGLAVLAGEAVIDRLLDEESGSLADLEEFTGKSISLRVEPGYTQEQFDVVLL